MNIVPNLLIAVVIISNFYYNFILRLITALFTSLCEGALVCFPGPLPYLMLLQARMLTAHDGTVMACAIGWVYWKHFNTWATPFVPLAGFNDHLTVQESRLNECRLVACILYGTWWIVKQGLIDIE